MSIRDFLRKNYKHFNAAVTLEAAEAWCAHLRNGGKMFLAMAGAMSTGEIGISLAELIRQKKVHAISTTGANLEEDIFNLVAHKEYKRVPHYRSLSEQDELALRDSGYNRVTDTCIPEESAMRRIEKRILKCWQKAEEGRQRYFPYEFIFQLFDDPTFKDDFQGELKNSWVYAAREQGLPIFTPGWEDSTLGNFIVSNKLKKNLKSCGMVRPGLEQMEVLIDWYRKNSGKSVGFFQIGGGIAGDFAICVVPLLLQDLKEKKTPLWGYFAQISDSTTSYGSYSGATPNEKITWSKLDKGTPRFMIESDASVVAPLIFQYVLESSSKKSAD